MPRHRCPTSDCPVCERIAEDRKEGVHFDEEHAIRQSERRYEAQLFGRGL